MAESNRAPGRVVLDLVARRAGRSGALWGLVFGGYIATSALGYASLYKTQAARTALAHSFGSSVGITALVGPARAIDTVAGFTVWRSLGVLSLVGAVWGLLLGTRLLRGEEEAGRWELLLAGHTTARRATAQALGGFGAGVAALFAVTAVITVAVGRSATVGLAAGPALYFSLTLVVGAAMFMTLGALTSQLAGTRRRAAGYAGAVFGISFALRMVADSEPTLHWLVWASPLGWVEETRPLTDPQPLALLPAAALVVLAASLALRLAGARDLGDALLADRDNASARLRLLGGPTGLAFRLSRPLWVSWLLAVAAFALLIGAIAKSGASATTGSSAIQTALSRLGGHGAAIEEYLGLTFLIVAITVAMIAAGQITAIRAEEADGRLENLLVNPVSRTRWLAGRLVLATGLVLAAGLLSGVGAWAGAAGNEVGFGSLVAAGVNVVPPALFVLGLGTLVYGAWPRLTSVVVYGYLAWSFLVEFVGSVVALSHWVLDTSVFFHMVPAPASGPNWTSLLVLTLLGLVAAVAGSALLERRDLAGS
jgi:ABC-2 type transport system permease protein